MYLSEKVMEEIRRNVSMLIVDGRAKGESDRETADWVAIYIDKYLNGSKSIPVKFIVGDLVKILGVNISGRVIKIKLVGSNVSDVRYGVDYWWEGAMRFAYFSEHDLEPKRG